MAAEKERQEAVEAPGAEPSSDFRGLAIFGKVNGRTSCISCFQNFQKIMKWSDLGVLRRG